MRRVGAAGLAAGLAALAAGRRPRPRAALGAHPLVQPVAHERDVLLELGRIRGPGEARRLCGGAALPSVLREPGAQQVRQRRVRALLPG